MSAMKLPTVVFEVRDVSSEETYWTLGVFLNLVDALMALNVDDPGDIGCHEADDYDDYRRIEVRARPIGWSGSGKVVAKVEWKGKWNEAADEFKWERAAVELPPDVARSPMEVVR